MEYQKIINLLDETTNQPSKFIARNWDEINDESKGKYDNSNIIFKTSMIKSNWCYYRDAYLLVKRTITFPNTATGGAAIRNTNKKVIFTNCAQFTDCITEINNTQVDDAQKIYIAIPMYNLIKRSDAYSKILGSLWQYYRDEPLQTVMVILLIFMLTTTIFIQIQTANNSTNRKEWYKRCWNNDSIKISK